jgi:hypothetical protein
MNHLLLFTISVGFGALAWIMLVISDWLLGDKPARLGAKRIQSPSVERPTYDPYVNGFASPHGIGATARKAS